jgi:FkbM family methyltransferase
VGAYAIFAARRGARVYAFEPEAANYAVLNRNVRLNGLAATVRAFPLALSDSARLDTLRLSTIEAGAALHAFGRDTDFKSERFEAVFQQGCLAVTLDHVVFDLGLEPPAHIKIDVDGLEPEVLRGAQRTLRHPALRSVLVEINERQPADLAIVQELDGLGLRVARKGEPVIDSSGRARMVNYVFARG